jgi:hypothetical protein
MKFISLFKSSITQINRKKRFFSNLPHDSHHKNEPHNENHDGPYPNEAYAFGRKPGTPLEGWEIITFSAIALSIGILVISNATSTEDDFKV